MWNPFWPLVYPGLQFPYRILPRNPVSALFQVLAGADFGSLLLKSLYSSNSASQENTVGCFDLCSVTSVRVTGLYHMMINTIRLYYNLSWS
jgi:hypothetical protein